MLTICACRRTRRLKPAPTGRARHNIEIHNDPGCQRFRHEPPVYGLWTLVLLFLLRVGHPPLIEDEPLGATRTILAIVALLVFILCFMPFPFTSGAAGQ